MAIDLHGTGVEVKLVLPGPIDTEIWDQPGNDAAAYDGPLVPAVDCAASIVDAITTPGFEFYAPPDLPGRHGIAARHRGRQDDRPRRVPRPHGPTPPGARG